MTPAELSHTKPKSVITGPVVHPGASTVDASDERTAAAPTPGQRNTAAPTSKLVTAAHTVGAKPQRRPLCLRRPTSIRVPPELTRANQIAAPGTAHDNRSAAKPTRRQHQPTALQRRRDTDSRQGSAGIFLTVSDGIRTRDRRDHNPTDVV